MSNKVRLDDVAALVAVQMMKRAYAQFEARKPGPCDAGAIVIIRTPSKEWASVAEVAWGLLVDALISAPDGAAEASEQRRYFEAYQATEVPFRAGRNGDEVSLSVGRGVSTVGISQDPERFLPPDLMDAADFVLDLGPPTPADVSAVAHQVTESRPGHELDAGQAAALTPRILRLARRPGQTGADYIERLETLLERAKKRAVAVKVEAPRDAPSLDRLHGMDEAVVWGKALAEDLKAYRSGTLPWSRVSGPACLLSGPPGCGKTLFARALAATCGCSLVTGSYGEWLGRDSAHQGTMLRAMRETFSDALASRPSILFIDEVDAFPNRATLKHSQADWEIQVVNTLLGLIDGAQSREGVVLIAACNYPDFLDPALVRSGRLDRHIRVRLPRPADLQRILREHLGEDLAGVDLAHVALLAAGSTGADCERYVRGARRRAREAGRLVTFDDLIQEIGTTELLTEDERWRAAIHEAGHAVVACELLPGAIEALALRGGADLGATFGMRMRPVFVAEDVRQRLTFLLAGRAAEEVLLGHPSSGAGGEFGSDLAVATKLATIAEAALGLGQDVLWRGMPREATLTSMLAEDALLAARVNAALSAAREAALALVRRRSAAVEAIASALLQRSATDGAEIARIVARHPASARVPA